MRSIAQTAALAALSALAPFVWAAEPGPTGFTTEELVRFGSALQAAVRADKADTVARFIAFPLPVNEGPTLSREIREAQFRREYTKVFTPDVKAAILAQDLSVLHQSWRGTMFGDGNVWVSGLCKDKSCSHSVLKVTAVNIRTP